MVTWAFGGLLALLFALKIVAVGAIVLACLAVWAIFRLFFRAVGSASRHSFNRSKRPVAQVYADPPRRPVCRYDEVQPVLQPATVIPNPKSHPGCGRGKSSSWVFWGVLGIVAAVVVLGMRSRSRNHVDYRFVSATADEVRPVPTTKKTDKRNNRKATSSTVPTTVIAEREAPSTTARATPAVERRSGPLNPSWTLVGVGETLDYAKEDACTKAWEQIVAYLHNEQPWLEWMPSRDFVQRNFARQWGAEEPHDLEKVGRVIKIPLHVELTPTDLATIAKHDKQFRVEHRMAWLGKLIAGLIALLVAVAGYVRLDEWSKGYYTGALRFVAAVFLLASAAGMWMLVRH